MNASASPSGSVAPADDTAGNRRPAVPGGHGPAAGGVEAVATVILALAATAEAAAEARRNIRHANDYVLAVVLCSAALFLGGISTRLHRPRPRAVVLGVGCAVLVGTLVWVATFPVSSSI